MIIIILRSGISNVPFLCNNQIIAFNLRFDYFISEPYFFQIVVGYKRKVYEPVYILLIAIVGKYKVPAIMEKTCVIIICILPCPILSSKLTERLIFIGDIISGIVTHDVGDLLFDFI